MKSTLAQDITRIGDGLHVKALRDKIREAADELNRLYTQEAERKSELDNIHDTILPRLTEEIRKLREEREQYRDATDKLQAALRHADHAVRHGINYDAELVQRQMAQAAKQDGSMVCVSPETIEQLLDECEIYRQGILEAENMLQAMRATRTACKTVLSAQNRLQKAIDDAQERTNQ